MDKIHTELAALTVFKALYDNDKNVYNVLWAFARNTIAKRKLQKFTASDLKLYFDEDYGFDNIPISVFKTMLRKHKQNELHIKNEDVYVMPVLKQTLVNPKEDIKMQEQERLFRPLIEELSAYIRQQRQEQYSLQEITEELRVYLLDDAKSGKFVNEINAFIIEKEQEKNEDFRNALNEVKEGFILYSGICWCAELNELGKWRQPLALYFDMDIIFYIAGYSGEIYQTIIKELYQLVQEINSTAAKQKKKRLISIRYFSEERERIDDYFKIAEQIVRNERTLDSSEPAMLYIVSRCETPSDVIGMRSNLDLLLENLGILEDKTSYYDNQDNWDNNITSKELINKYVINKYPQEKVERYLKRISYISFIRKGNESTDFMNCKAIMVTRNRTAIQLDRDADTLITKKQYQRVISPEVLTSQFWFQLNKGFAEKPLLNSVDVLVQAKIIMAKQVNVKIAECHQKIMDSYNKGEVTEEQAVRQCAHFRKYCVTPDDVTNEMLAETCSLAESSVREMMQKQDELVDLQVQTQCENKYLKKQHEELMQSIRYEHERAEQQIAATQEKDRYIEEQTDLLCSKERQITDQAQMISDRDSQIAQLQEQLQLQRQHELDKIEKRGKRIQIAGYIVAIIGIISCIIIYLCGISKHAVYAEIISGVLGVLGLLIPFIEKNVTKIKMEREGK